MPSTYSSLKIQLMATGENTTTWGDVTNTNLGTAIEEAIVGSADVTFASGNVTLTLSDTNTTQAARNVRLRCTGTTGGATRNLVVPSIEKPYIVQNDCADSIVVKTAAGSGVTVPAGKTSWVYSNGTNVVDVVTHLTSLTLGSPLAVAQGGTGATDAATARTNLGAGTVTSVGGTGTVNGLTLSGTVTGSGSLTLGGTLTGVNLTSAVTGTLPTANGGTGVSSAANGQLLIGNGTGFSLATLTQGSGITITNSAGGITIAATGSMVYPGAGIAVSTGSAWGTSLTAPSGALVGTTDSQTLSNKTLDANNSVSDTGTIGASSPGFRGLPISSKTTSYTLALTDAGKMISITTGGVVIPANGSVAFPNGTAVVVYNDSASTQTISITTDTLRLAGTATTGSRTLAAYGFVTLTKVSSTVWVASGSVT